MSTQGGRRRRPADDFDREIDAHLGLEIDRLILDGLSPEQARTAARQRFGNVTRAREQFHERGRLMWLDHLLHDFRCGLRNLRRYPVAALVAITSLAAGIGATTVTLTMRDAVYYKAPPLYADPGQLSQVQTGTPDRPIMPAGSPVPAPLYSLWRATLAHQMGADRGLGARDVRSGDSRAVLQLRGVTPELFDVLGVRPELGETFAAVTTTTSDAPPVMLSHHVWATLFGSRRDVVGETLWIDERPHTVIGVMPQRFWFSDMASPIWTRLDVASLDADDGLAMVVRRTPGTSAEALAAQLQNELTAYASRLPASRREMRLRVSGIEGTPVGRQMSAVLPYLLGTSVLLTLLIACANVAILLIAQWTGREREIAIRAAIGASRGRIARALVTESVLLATLGGGLGLAVTLALHRWVTTHAGDVTFFDLSINPMVLVETALVTLLSGIAAGLAPALYETRRLEANPLRTLASSDRLRQRWRHGLVVFEIAVTVALLVETGAMIDGYQRARRAEIGFSIQPLISARVEASKGIPIPQVLEALAAVPGVTAVAASTAMPMATGPQRAAVAGDEAGTRVVTADKAAISRAFFEVLDVPLRAGRPFSADDVPKARTAIVNEALASKLFAGVPPIGQRLWIQQVPYDVVGVVADYANHPLQQANTVSRVFLPLPLAPTPDIRRLQFVVRASGNPGPLVEPIRRRALAVAPGLSVSGANAMNQIVVIMGQEVLVGTAPLVPLIAIGMFLTASGIYGVLAFAVSRRSREIAVRIAVGATSRDLAALVGGQGVRLVLAGAAIGIGVTFGLARIVRAGGGTGSMFDPSLPSFVVPVLVVLAVGVLATWVPSRRAQRIDPATLLKAD